MRAVARIVAEPDGRGGTRLVELYGEAPLLSRRTGPAEVHLVGGAAGPIGGDELRLEVELRAGARLTLRTVAATVALPGRGRSTMDIRVQVAAGASLWWLPEPLVAAAGCNHRTVCTVELAEGAHLVWREELVAGRHGESPGDLTTALRVRLNQEPLLYQDLAVGPRAAGYDGAAMLGSARTAGSVLVVDPLWTAGTHPAATVTDGALMALAGPAMLATAVAPDSHTLRIRLAELTRGITMNDDTARQRSVHSTETNGDCTGQRPAIAAGRA